LTHLQRVVPEAPLPFPHVLSDLTATMPGGIKHKFDTFGFFVAFNEGGVSGEEIGTALNIFGNFIGNEVLPVFKDFFSNLLDA
jgi:hypothetical protein